MKKFFKKHNKIITIIILAILIAILVVVKIVKIKNKNNEPEYEIAKIEKRTLTNSISCSGNLKTEESKNVTSLLVGSKITGVNVKVGDKVNVGDVLVTFDTETLSKTAKDLAASINAAKQQSNISVAGAERAVQDAENSKNSSLDQAKTAKDQAQAAYDSATQTKNSSLPGLNANLSNLQSELATYVPIEQKYNAATDSVAKAQLAVNSAQDNYNKIVASVTAIDPSLVGSSPEVLEANTALLAANAALVSSQNNLESAKNAYMAIADRYSNLQQQISSISAQIASLNQAVEQTKSAYDQAEKAYNNTLATLDSAVLNAKDAAATSKIGSSTATLTLEEQLVATNKQLEEGSLKSTVSGTVTAVNARKGDNYQGGTLVTIEGVENFILEANVDEYDIADIQEGMDVIIKTDATRDEELLGKVIFVAPASNEVVSGSAMTSASAISGTTPTTSEATYLVKIELLSSNDRLKLGMSAKASIITEKAEKVLCVPYDAITEKENGKKVITIINDDESQKEITVDVGLESGYYSEIRSNKIKEGMKIVLPKLEGSSTLDELLDSMGATGGIE